MVKLHRVILRTQQEIALEYFVDFIASNSFWIDITKGVFNVVEIGIIVPVRTSGYCVTNRKIYKKEDKNKIIYCNIKYQNLFTILHKFVTDK